MNRDELGLNAWILTGNVLNLLLNGTARHHADQLGRAHLQQLNDILSGLPPQRMLGALEQLAQEDRDLLKQACECAYVLADLDAEAVLGLDRSAAQPVLEYLQGHKLALNQQG